MVNVLMLTSRQTMLARKRTLVTLMLERKRTVLTLALSKYNRTLALMMHASTMVGVSLRRMVATPIMR